MQNHSGGFIPLQGSWFLPVYLRGDNLVRSSLNVSLAEAATSIFFVAANTSFVTTIFLSQQTSNFVVTSLLLSWQTRVCQDKRICRDKTFVVTKMILVAATANDTHEQAQLQGFHLYSRLPPHQKGITMPSLCKRKPMAQSFFFHPLRLESAEHRWRSN